jgi:hypothetical protein
MTPTSGGQRYAFNFQPSVLYPEGYGKNTTPFRTGGPGGGGAQFVVEDGVVLGFGLFLRGYEDSTMRAERPMTIQDQADAWFDRL